jgi:hypothetical protein
MKVDITKYVASCGICQKVKAEHQRPARLLKPLEIPTWKFENITMDFVVGLPHSPRGKDAIWFVIDRLTKVAHFLPMKTTNSASDLVPLYIKEVVRLHGVPKSIVSNRDSKFVSNFWTSFHSALGTNLDLSTTFHPSDRRSVRVYHSDLKGLFCVLVCSLGRALRRITCHWQSFLIITPIRPVSRWLHLKHRTVAGVFPHSVGMLLVGC